MLDRQTPLQQQETTRQPMGGAVDEPIRRRESEPPQSNVTAPASASSPAEQPTTGAPADAAPLKEEAKREQRPVDKASEADQTAPTGAMAPKDLAPQEWLRRIVELRKQGKLNEAQSSFAEFRRRYPDYPADAILK
jgi:TolA-binding protein